MKCILNPTVRMVRLSPKEIMLIYGVLSKPYLLLSLASERACENAMALLTELSTKPRKVESIRKEMTTNCGIDDPTFKSMLTGSVLVPSGSTSSLGLMYPALGNAQRTGLFVLDDGGQLGQSFRRNIGSLGVAHEIVGSAASALEKRDGRRKKGPGNLVVTLLDNWDPRYLRDVEKECFKRNLRFLPVFLLPDGGSIGPLVVPHETATYLSFERQMEASLMSYQAWRTYRDFLMQGKRGKSRWKLPRPFVELVGSLSSILAANAAYGNGEMLTNKVVIIDFARLFIDSIRVYRTPSTEYSPLIVRDEF
jgi:hypothetical protein